MNHLPSGKRLHNYGKSPFLWVNHLFLWAIYTIAILTYPEGMVDPRDCGRLCFSEMVNDWRGSFSEWKLHNFDDHYIEIANMIAIW